MERMRKRTRHEQRLGQPEQPGLRDLRTSVGASGAGVLEGPCEEIAAVVGFAREGTTSCNASRCTANFGLDDIRERQLHMACVYSPTCEASATFVYLNGLKSSLIGGPFLRARVPKKGFGGPCVTLASDGFGFGDADALPFPGPAEAYNRVVIY